MDGAHFRLKNARINAGFRTARAAAKRFGWNTSTYGAHENGQNGFAIETAAQYARAFGVRLQYLLFGEGSAEPTQPLQESSLSEPQMLDPARTAHVISALLRRVRSDMSGEDADLWAQVAIERALQSPDPASEKIDQIQTNLLAQFGARKLSQP
jgi:DNA-binding XRE family transcriptional regulator